MCVVTKPPGLNAGSTGAQWNQLGLQTAMGLRNLKLMNHMNAAGSTAGQMVHYAAMAIEAGLCNTVACVFADAPLMAGQSAGSAYARPRGGTVGLSAITSLLSELHLAASAEEARRILSRVRKHAVENKGPVTREAVAAIWREVRNHSLPNCA